MKLPIDLVWFVVVAGMALMAAALWLLRADAVPLLELGIPAAFALVGAGRWIDARAAGPAG